MFSIRPFLSGRRSGAARPTVPGPRGRWLAGCAAAYYGDRLGFFTRVWQEYGRYVHFRVYRGNHYLLTDPAAVEDVLQKKHANFPKPASFQRALGPLLGDVLVTSEGANWARQRRMLQPAFHRRPLARLSTFMVAAAETFVRACAPNSGQAVDMLDHMLALTLRMAGTVLFGTDVSATAVLLRREFAGAMGYVNRRMNLPTWIPAWLGANGVRTFRRAKDAMDQRVAALVETQQQAPDSPATLLTLLRSARDEATGARMTAEEVNNEVLAILTAGIESTASALTWMWYLLGQHPDIQEDVAAEVRDRLQGRPPAAEDLPHLPLARAIFDETMRLYPPAWVLSRQAAGPDTIQGYAIPGDSIIHLCPFLTHRDPELWEAPEQFRPERFLAPRPAPHSRFRYLPFGAGPRVCIGASFALLAGPLVLATAMQKFRIALVPGQAVIPDTSFTLRPRGGLKMLLQPRP
jgi:cytochrome P450